LEIENGVLGLDRDINLNIVKFLFENIFSILFYIIFANFKVLDIFLERAVHILFLKGKDPMFLEKVFYI
jgi:hypothetical protein